MPPALIAALAAEHEQISRPPVSKGRLSLAFKGAQRALGLSASTVDTVLLLIGLVDAKALSVGARPVVAPSNSFLAYSAGVTIRAIQARLAAAIGAGLLIPLDAPDGKRSVRRHSQDRNETEAYGFDLSPLVRRYAEFEQMRTEFLTVYREGQSLRRRIGAVRNGCLALVDELARAGSDDALDLAAEVHAIVQRRADHIDPTILAPILAELRANHEALTRLLASSQTVDAASEGEAECTHQETTRQKPVSEETTNLSNPVAPGRRAFHAKGKSEHDPQPLNGSKPITGDFPLTPALAVRIAPYFTAFLTRPGPDWASLIDVAPNVAGSMGIGKWAWGSACQKLGRLAALAVLIAVAGRTERGSVVNPGGLFTRMVELHLTGHLRLDRTLYGLIERPHIPVC